MQALVWQCSSIVHGVCENAIYCQITGSSLVKRFYTLSVTHLPRHAVPVLVSRYRSLKLQLNLVSWYRSQIVRRRSFGITWTVW